MSRGCVSKFDTPSRASGVSLMNVSAMAPEPTTVETKMAVPGDPAV
jgi:hypothetical protein